MGELVFLKDPKAYRLWAVCCVMCRVEAVVLATGVQFCPSCGISFDAVRGTRMPSVELLLDERSEQEETR